MSLLEKLDGPEYIKRLSPAGLRTLASEIRELIVRTVAVNGGHLASNLGVVELTLALHRVFSTPADSIFWDVGHQCYAHKIVTGRLSAFPGIRLSGGLSGFPKRSESEHDAFEAGHASTSISAALGKLVANRRRGSDGAVVAVIGDGALTGGMAWEALSNAGQLGLPLIVVVNDNSMSISPNVGALSSYLSRLSATVRYQRLRRVLDRMILGVPLVGRQLHPLVLRLKHAVKAVFFKKSLFAELGFEYAGPIDGHNIPMLTDVLREAREIRRPVVVHIVTKKGKGHYEAERNPAAFHGVSPSRTVEPRPTFTEAFGTAMVRAAREDPALVAVVAAMTSGTGLSAFQKEFPDRFFDVGIAEQHAVTFAAGMASGGLHPVVAIYSTFMQRCVDQVHHDVALADRHVIFAMDRAGAVPDDGETHQGIYDAQIFRAVPGLAILAPASAVEVDAALRWALSASGPVMIRYPKAICPPERPAYAEPFAYGKGVYVRRGESKSPILFAVSGALVETALAAADACEREGASADVYHLRFLKPVDAAAFVSIALSYQVVVIAEEAVATGSIAAELAAMVNAAGRTLALAKGFDERPLPQAGREELLARAGLSAGALALAAQTSLVAVSGADLVLGNNA